MTKPKYTKHALVKVPADDAYFKKKGIVALQLVTITHYFYGSKQEDTFDTAIYKDGKQKIISGNGFFPDGTEIPKN